MFDIVSSPEFLSDLVSLKDKYKRVDELAYGFQWTVQRHPMKYGIDIGEGIRLFTAEQPLEGAVQMVFLYKVDLDANKVSLLRCFESQDR